jgi:hypothetical protein
MKYHYLKNIHEDILEYIRNNYTTEEIREALENREEFEETLNNDLWACDSVTGNASGSYWFNAWKAEEALCHNLDILAEALREFGCDDVNALKKGAEWCDVTIRCYLLPLAIYTALDELEKEATQ